MIWRIHCTDHKSDNLLREHIAIVHMCEEELNFGESFAVNIFIVDVFDEVANWIFSLWINDGMKQLSADDKTTVYRTVVVPFRRGKA